ncbi:MAG: respiratory nitrate reductase subunit gamma [Archaeoglobaceae archaeon]
MAISMLQLSSYVAFAIFVVVIAAKWRYWSGMPLHLRWELYPVPHEKGKSKYGGSYYEELDWWTKPRETTLIGELKDLMEEMLFIKRAWEYKRELWLVTYPFHIGIYLILAWFALLFIGGLTEAYGGLQIGAAHPWSQLIYYLTLITGGLGIILGILGSIGTLALRVSDDGMRKWSTPIHYINLVFILVVFVLGAYAFITSDLSPAFATAQGYMTSLVSFGSVEAPALSSAILAHLILLELLFVYIPFTKMSHFIGKYFTFHKVYWDDEPNLRGSKIEAKVKEMLEYRVDWAGPHYVPGMTWAEEATKVEPWGEKKEEVKE